MKRIFYLIVFKVKVFFEKERYFINLIYFKFICGYFKMVGYFNFFFFSRKMLFVYYEYCGKFGLKSNDYVFLFEVRYFKFWSVFNFFLMGEWRFVIFRDFLCFV